MDNKLIIPGRYTGQTFIPESPLPEVEGTAQLIITPTPTCVRGSIADAFGSAKVLRAGADILAQFRADRDE